MSVGYASGLSEYANKGVCGLPEFFDDTITLESKIDELHRLMVESAYTVVHTGAGISTPVGIPDFRGPKGVWTLEKLGEKPTVSVSFEKAMPSLAHRILVELERKNLIQYLITQNIDGLHFRSGFPRNRLSILHGDMFLEVCDTCGSFFARSTPSTTMGLRRTDVFCTYTKPSGRGCRGRLCDTILDWESDLPELDYHLAIEHSNRADLHICIGTSLQMYPAASLPLLPRRSSTSASACNKIRKCDPENNLSSHRSKLVIINLQKTKLSKRANLNIHAPADVVLDAIAKKFHLAISSTVPSSDIFVPMLLLRSVHSTPTDSIPWRVFPHPTAGSLVQILESLVSPKTEAIHSSTDPVRKPTGNAEGHDPKGSIKVTDQNLGISDLKVESTAKTSV
ncbi:NAD-dependent protein deacetylase sirtuin-6 [Clonorchis sinensis]|uniref:protein acetyllysine N-acetyltransferase n=1 Tax=Clonorchis sinensis TaxID=79923 RepID=A0A8T1MR19_CLOSI|nr:NAD-dependent protein deacetylase sirtuin-6 [Clonorchis sinensis]